MHAPAGVRAHASQQGFRKGLAMQRRLGGLKGAESFKDVDVRQELGPKMERLPIIMWL